MGSGVGGVTVKRDRATCGAVGVRDHFEIKGPFDHNSERERGRWRAREESERGRAPYRAKCIGGGGNRNEGE